MILVDVSQVMISTLMVQLGNHYSSDIDENMLRHMVLNVLRSNRKKFRQEYGELVICCDGKACWRRDVFPYYKAARRKSRESSELDWNHIFSVLNKVRNELSEFFPYKVLHLDSCEADDIIGTICHTYGSPLNTGEKILILSGDKDYIQLHSYANVFQYDPTRKKKITHNDPDDYLFEHIVKGDAGDGIPNVRSPDNTFVMNIRQKPVTKKLILQWKESLSNMTPDQKRNFDRNKVLIDLKNTPDEIKDRITSAFENYESPGRKHLFNYFMQHRLKHLTEHIEEF